MHSISSLVGPALLAAAPLVSAHGYVSNIVANGQSYPAVNDPVWFYSSTKPQKAGWFALNQDIGFVPPNSYGTSDIACHKSATAGTTEIAVTAGSKVTVTWNTWPGDSHKGPVIDALAKCSGSCTTAKAADLNFFKIAQQGLTTSSQTWATDKLMSNSLNWDITIPSSLVAGSYVLRHEIIALHGAGSQNGAQSYPQCINLKVLGGGSAAPAGSKAATWYTPTDPGILINIYQTLSSYTIPGPALSTIKKRVAAKMFKEEVAME